MPGPKSSELWNKLEKTNNNSTLPIIPKSTPIGLPTPPPMPGPYPQGPSVYPKLLPTPPPMPGQYPSMPSPYGVKEKVDGGRHFRKRRHTKKSKHPKRKTRKSSRRHH